MYTCLIALVLTRMPAPVLGQSTSGRGTAVRPRAPAEPWYLLFWRSPEQAADLVQRIGATGDGRTRLLGFGMPCSLFAAEKRVPELVHSAFAAARRNNLAVMLQFDFHVDWKNRPDLWNWFNPAKPGYDPNNRANVEWFRWEGPPAKARYLNWGKPARMAPPMCFTSKTIRAEWHRLIGKVIAPAIKPELALRQRAGKSRLLAGILVGSEPTFDNYQQTDPETARMVAEDGTPRGQLGYRALIERGYHASNPPPNIVRALAGVVQETVGVWCREFAEAGIARSKLYRHVPAGSDDAVTCPPAWTAFNEWQRPGWSTYAVGPLAEGLSSLYSELKRCGSSPWGGVEANAGIPGSLVD